MTPEAREALDRYMQGRPRAGDQEILQKALLRMAPSTPEAKAIMAAIGQDMPRIPGVSSERERPAPLRRETNADYGFRENSNAWTPTADFAEGLPNPFDIFGGQPPNPVGGIQNIVQGGGAPIQIGDDELEARANAERLANPDDPLIQPGNPLDGISAQPGVPGLVMNAVDRLAPGQPPSVSDDMLAAQIAERERQAAAQVDQVAGASTTPTQPKGGTSAPITDFKGQAVHAATGQDLRTDVQGEGWDDPGITISPNGDYSFSGSTPNAIEMLYGQPEAFLQRYTKAKGMPNEAAFLADPFDAALGLSQYGVLGKSYDVPGMGAPNLFSGDAKSYQEQLQDVESFLNEYNQPGAAVDPSYYVEQTLDRAITTDWENVINPDTQQPYTANQIIDQTNAAVMAVSKLMPAESQDWLASVLIQASSEYRNAVTDGTINLLDMSYAQFLRDEKQLAEYMR